MRRRTPRLALDRLSQSEIEVLQQPERRAALERREQELDRRAALLATAEANVATQLERLEQLRAEIAATITRRMTPRKMASSRAWSRSTKR